MARAAGKTDKMLTCSLYSNTTKSVCKSIQNAAFHGAEGHAEYVHKQFHARTRKSEAFPKDGQNPKDTGKSSVRGDWEKAGRKSRAEEMATAAHALRDPELDGEIILLLVQEA